MDDTPAQLIPFTGYEPIHITCGGGNIGRFFWCNQQQLTIESWRAGLNMYSDPPSERDVQTIPGSCAWIHSLMDWYAWIMT